MREDVTERRRAQWRRSSRKYRRTEKGIAAGRRHNAERSANMYFYNYAQAHLAQRAMNSRASRARKKAYLEELFADAPEKRVYVS